MSNNEPRIFNSCSSHKRARSRTFPRTLEADVVPQNQLARSSGLAGPPTNIINFFALPGYNIKAYWACSGRELTFRNGSILYKILDDWSLRRFKQTQCSQQDLFLKLRLIRCSQRPTEVERYPKRPWGVYSFRVIAD